MAAETASHWRAQKIFITILQPYILSFTPSSSGLFLVEIFNGFLYRGCYQIFALATSLILCQVLNIACYSVLPDNNHYAAFRVK